jgi:poly-gamma-glutamate synthesis protein (capsule biosynthesis protein)
MKRKLLLIIPLVMSLLIVVGLFAFRAAQPFFSPDPEEELPLFVPPAGTEGPTPTNFGPTAPTPTSQPPQIWLDSALPDSYLEQISSGLNIQVSELRDEAAVVVLPGEENVISRWVYALVAPFPTTEDNVSGTEIRSAWQGQESPTFNGSPIFLTANTLEVFSRLWGDPAEGAVRVIAPDQLLETVWERRPAWALIPFDELEPRWKVLAVDGSSPLQKDFMGEEYALSAPISVLGDSGLVNGLDISNRDPEQLSTVMLTGVTALVRATAWTMENNGVEYPARDIRDWLLEADILHISNEVPFVRGCPYPDPSQSGLRFCSNPKYLRLLESIGTDVVELTGDHFGDYGPEAMLNTLELYNLRDWPYYGGGKDRADAQKAVKFEHNGNKIAFIGCNAKGGGYATAAENNPGAVACDFNQMTASIQELTADGYLVIGTFQHFEYYTYFAQPDQIRDARRLTEAGAVIVSGSQAHQPQAFEIREGAFVHHGLGNLFFDQIYEIPPNTATAFIDRHVFYAGKHISTELLTIQFEDFARARPMNLAERQALLNTVFSASGW